MAKPLPDPQWVASAACLRCGYLLTGLAAPGRCPECGTVFLAQHLLLHGVPRTGAGASPLRRVAWVAVIGAAVIYSQAWTWLLFASWILAGILALGIVAGLLALVLTSPRERGGAERLAIAPDGIFRLPLKQPGEHQLPDSALVPWSAACVLELHRISAVWYRLRIGIAQPGGGLQQVLLDAGVRCTDAFADQVRQTIHDFISRAQMPHSAPDP